MLITNIRTMQRMLRTLARISGYGTGPLEHLEKSEKQPASCSSSVQGLKDEVFTLKKGVFFWAASNWKRSHCEEALFDF